MVLGLGFGLLTIVRECKIGALHDIRQIRIQDMAPDNSNATSDGKR